MSALRHSETDSEPTPRRPRGWFLRERNARVIDRGDLYIVEFADHPWYTQALRRRNRRFALVCTVLQALHLL